MNAETRAVLARIPEEVLESLYTDDTYNFEFSRCHTIGRRTTALIITLHEAGQTAAAANEFPLSSSSIPQDELAELVYVIQPDDMEQLSAKQLVALFYAYCGALFNAETTAVESPRGAMAVAELLVSLNIISSMPLFSQLVQHMPEEPKMYIPTGLADCIENIGYTFTNPSVLAVFAIKYTRLSVYRTRLSLIGRRLVKYVAGVSKSMGLLTSEKNLAQYAVRHELHRNLVCFSHFPGLFGAIYNYPTQLHNYPRDVLTLRATAELANAMLAVIGAVFVDSDFSSAVALVTSAKFRFPLA